MFSLVHAHLELKACGVGRWEAGGVMDAPNDSGRRIRWSLFAVGTNAIEGVAIKPIPFFARIESVISCSVTIDDVTLSAEGSIGRTQPTAFPC